MRKELKFLAYEARILERMSGDRRRLRRTLIKALRQHLPELREIREELWDAGNLDEWQTAWMVCRRVRDTTTGGLSDKAIVWAIKRLIEKLEEEAEDATARSDTIVGPVMGWIFRPPFRCICCGEEICARQFAYGRACGPCDIGMCQEGNRSFNEEYQHDKPAWWRMDDQEMVDAFAKEVGAVKEEQCQKSGS